MLKQAYTGVGLCVARRGDDLLFSGSGWAIATEKGSMDKKQLAAVIELTGELPGDGEALKATKEENQYEIGEVHWDNREPRGRRKINRDAGCVRKISIWQGYEGIAGSRRTSRGAG